MRHCFSFQSNMLPDSDHITSEICRSDRNDGGISIFYAICLCCVQAEAVQLTKLPCLHVRVPSEQGPRICSRLDCHIVQLTKKYFNVKTYMSQVLTLVYYGERFAFLMSPYVNTVGANCIIVF